MLRPAKAGLAMTLLFAAGRPFIRRGKSGSLVLGGKRGLLRRKRRGKVLLAMTIVKKTP